MIRAKIDPMLAEVSRYDLVVWLNRNWSNIGLWLLHGKRIYLADPTVKRVTIGLTVTVVERKKS
jgi:hypothetical protein